MDTAFFPNSSGAKEFLGTYQEHDLYWDPQEFFGFPTVIARYGAINYEYKCGLSAAEHDVHLKEAKRRASLLGFDVKFPQK